MNIVLTGAAGALGAAVRTHLRDQGHRLACIDMSAPEPDDERTAWVVCADLADPAAAVAALQAARAWLGSVDALVHLVGGFAWMRIVDSTPADWHALFRANIDTSVSTLRAALPALTAGGAVLFVGAAAANRAGEGMAPYAAAKSGVARLVEALAVELAPQGVRVNGIMPQTIDTPRNRADMPDVDPSAWTTPAAIAEVVAFLIGPQARAINGAMIPVTNAA